MMTAEMLKLCHDLKAYHAGHHDELVHFIDEFIEKYNLPESVTLDWSHDNIEWEPTSGPKGPYWLATYQDTVDFRLLTRDLDANGGTLRRGPNFYWQFSRRAKIGCKAID
jgi:hypothetical protein